MKTTYQLMSLLFFCVAISVSAQEKLTKVSKKIDVTKNVEIDLNTSYVQIEIDTWNKNTLEVEAYVQGEKLSKEELQEALNEWDLKVEGSGSNVKISSNGSHGSWNRLGYDNMNFEALSALEALGDMDFTDIPEMPEMPELPELPEMARLEVPEAPEMPELPTLPNGITNVSFDTEAYKKEGEAYLEKWSRDYPENLREPMKNWGRQMAKVDFSSYEKRMEAWGEKFGKQFGEDYGKKMEAWGEEFGKRFDGEWSKKMEAWGERYGKQMEERAKTMEKRMEASQKMMEKRREKMEKVQVKRLEANQKRHEHLSDFFESKGDNVKRIIKIKMPKDAKLNMNVRHGELKMSSVIYNLKANISHAIVLANHIDGSATSINVSYSPIDVTTWSDGELNLKYVDDAHLAMVSSLRLNSNSSDMHIDNLTGTAIIDGSFGDLSISNITEDFTNLNIILENSEAIIKLPNKTVDYSMYFKGNRSRLNDELTSQQTINNHPNTNKSGKTIVINAKFSDVALKE
ncbi:hypothetical protein [Psychroserpens sp. Hel_I_66]|uniref:hypothetical protein n=1 Tax=Psychroserpens sp. Hel_I_66 TaxID=1250004 RepID=UPI0006459DCE|nr:hypothetical protein [Psychroserpens sp. Hel_I_66]